MPLGFQYSYHDYLVDEGLPPNNAYISDYDPEVLSYSVPLIDPLTSQASGSVRPKLSFPAMKMQTFASTIQEELIQIESFDRLLLDNSNTRIDTVITMAEITLNMRYNEFPLSMLEFDFSTEGTHELANPKVCFYYSPNGS